jgi:6-phosphogluconolactonase (cycloisomerase 2 family)
MSGATDPTCALSSTSATASTTSTLTVTTASSTTQGLYSVKVTGTSGSTTESTTVCVDVTTSTTSSCSSTASTSGNFYILNSDSIAGYTFKSSVLTALSGSPTTLPSGVTPWAIAVDPTGSFLYVSTNNGILLYKIGTGGALTLNSSATLGDDTSYALQIDSTGQWLLDASNTVAGPVLYAWPISSTTGQSTLGNGINTPALQLTAGTSIGLGGIAISADNKLVSVAAGAATYTIGFTPGSGNNGSTSPFGTAYHSNAIGTAVSVAFDPSTRFLYIGETGVYGSSTTNSGALRMFAVTSDVLGNEVSTSPVHSGGTGPHGILAASNGFVYVANWVETSAGSIATFQLNASTPALTLQSSNATGTEPYGIAEDKSSSYVMTVNSQGNPYFNAFTFDATTAGQLDSAGTGSTGSGPLAIVAVP